MYIYTYFVSINLIEVLSAFRNLFCSDSFDIIAVFIGLEEQA